MTVKNKLKIFMIFLILFISIASVSANEDLSDSSSLAVADNDDVDLIENVNVDDFDSGSDSLASEDVVLESDSVVCEDVVLESDSVVCEDVGSDSIAYEDNDDGESSLSSSNLNSNGLGDSAKTFGDIQSLVDSAEVNDIILLNGTYESSGKAISVNKSLTIDGQGLTTLDAKKLSSIFEIKADNFVLKNLKMVNNTANKTTTVIIGENNLIEHCIFADNHAGSDGGAVYGNCSILDCAFTNNSAFFGGAVYGDCSIVNCNFTDNYAYEYGGAVYSGGSVNSKISNCLFIHNWAYEEDELYDYPMLLGDGGAIYFTSGNSEIENCKFISNYAGSDGGAIMGPCSVVNCNFTNNSAANGGAVIGDCTVVNCNFTNNSATYDGGAIYNVMVVNSLFENNSARVGGAMFEGSAANCTFNNNNASVAGGAIAKATVLSDCQFSNNHAAEGNDTSNVTMVNPPNTKTLADLDILINNNTDEDIYLDGNYTFYLTRDIFLRDGIIINRSVTIYGNGFTINGGGTSRIFYVTNSNVILKNITFINGFTNKDGGAVYGDCSVVNCSFTENYADEDGGAVYGNCSILDCNFTNNRAHWDGGAVYGNCSILDCAFTNNDVDSDGGAVFGDCSVVNCAFTNNGAFHNGGAYGGAGYIVNCTFNNNTSGSGGAIFVSSDSSSTIMNCTFYNNTAEDKDGGAIYVRSANTRILNCVFKNNRALFESSFPEDEGIFSAGGAIYSKYDDSKIENCSFNNNTANLGGAFCGLGSFVGCNFTGNFASHEGGAIRGSSSVVGCTFTDNYADEHGGAIYHYSGSLSIGNSTFSHNSACLGGASIYLYSGSLSIGNSTFTGNYVYETGAGAIDVKSCNSLSVLNSNFTNNSGVGSLSAVGGAINVDFGNSTISNCIFRNNRAFTSFEDYPIGYGGAICLGSSGNSNIKNCTFINNTANDGGAVHSAGTNLKVTNCRFTSNSAGTYGGAIYVGSGSLTVSNSTFNKNVAKYSGYVGNDKYETGKGGAICFASASKNSLIDGCTFTSNNALFDGGAVYSSAPSLKIRNSKFNSNAAQNGGAVYTGGKNCMIFNSNFTKNQASSKGGAITWTSKASGRINKCIFTQNTAKVDGGAIDWNVKTKNITNCKFNNNKSPRENDVCGLYTLRVSKAGVYAGNVLLTMKLYNAFTNKLAKNAELNLAFTNSKGKKTLKSFTTNAKGLVRYYVALPAGRYTVTFKAKWALSNKVAINVKKFNARLYANKLTTTYKSGLTYNVRMVNTLTKQRPTNVKIALRVYTGKKAQTLYALTRNGLARFDISSIAAGTHKVIVSSALNSARASRVTSQLVIRRGNFKVTAPKVQNKLNQAQSFKVKVITKNTKKPAKALNVRIRIYTGKQYKTYTRRTNANGIASITTKSLTRGTHRVIVSSGDRNCAFNVKSSIVIVK